MNAPQKKASFISRASVPLMIAVLIAPMVAAWIMFKYFPDSVRTLGTSNYGEFVLPPVDVTVKGLVDIDSKPVAEDMFMKKWTYVFLHSGNCDDACQGHIKLLHNLRLTQGKEVNRVKVLFATNKADLTDELKGRVQKLQGLQTIVFENEEQQKAFSGPFLFKGNEQALTAMNFYVVDPAGKLMLYYRHDKEILKLAKGMQGDMAKLLKNSKLRK